MVILFLRRCDNDRAQRYDFQVRKHRLEALQVALIVIQIFPELLNLFLHGLNDLLKEFGLDQ